MDAIAPVARKAVEHAGRPRRRDAERGFEATQSSAISQDGTAIGYRRLGTGPGVLVIHGAMETSESHTQLAEELARDFAVVLLDRRGRGLSGPFAADHCLAREVEDVDAVLRATRAECVFAVSAGAIVGLEAGRRLPHIKRLAIWDPPLSIRGSVAIDWVARFDRKVAEGDLVAALAIATRGTQLFGSRMPNWLLKLMIRVMAREMIALTPTFHYDAQLVVETFDRWKDFADVSAEVLLLGGGRSPAYMRTALIALDAVLPRSRRVEFRRLNHGGSGNRNRGGRPELVASELNAFFHEGLGGALRR